MNPSHMRIIILEDESSHTEAIRRALAAVGMEAEIQAAGTLREYRERVAARPPDIALADLNLPDGRAMDILTSPPEDGPFPVLVMTSHGNEQIAVEAMKAGALDYVVKSPEAFAAVPQILERALREWKLLQEWKHSEREVARTAREWQGTFDSTNDAIWVLDKDQRVLRSNKTAERIFHCPHGELIGKHCWEIVHGTAQPIPECPILRARESLRRETMELEIGERWFEVIVDPILDSSGGYAGAVHIVSNITERKRVEQAVRASLDYLDNVINTVGDPIFANDDQHRFVLVNDAECVLAGHPRSELIGRTDYDFFPRGQVDVFWKTDDKVLASGEENSNEEIITDARTGELRTIITRKTRYVDPSGNRFVVGAIRDITERKRAEEALRESEEKFRRVVETALEGVWFLDREFRTIEVNDAAIRMLGYSPEELIGRPFIDLLSDEDRPMQVREFQRRACGESGQYERKIRCKDGGAKWLFLSAKAVMSADGAFIGSFAMITDITERKRAEEALKTSEEKYRFLFESIPLSIGISTLDGRALMANRGCEELTGFTKEDFCALKEVSEMYVDGAQRKQLMALLQKEGKVRDFEAVLKRKNGTLYYALMNVDFIELAGEQAVLTIVRDITERKRAEEKEREMERRLLHTQKLESLGVLAGGIAHDFNNLLTAILGNMDLALDDLSPLSPARRSIEDAINATKRAETLTRQMLAYSGKGRFIVNDMDLSELVEENAHLLKAALSKSTILSLHLGRELPPISADAGQIQQVVMNLITNASESLGEQAGIVALSTGAMDCDDAYLNRSRTEDKPPAGRFVWLEVTDTGCGMDEETQQRIFDPFFTTKFTGRGLGMSAVLGIVRGHQGAITVESEVGKGTTIRVLFPVSKMAPVERGRKEKAARGRIRDAGMPPLSCTVLVVDDEEMVRRPCAAMVEHAGYRALTAANGDKAVALFRDHADEIVCVILDLTMPGMDGVATFEALRAIKPDVKVILSSGYNEQQATQRFSRQGLAGFIKKPYEMETLLAELGRVAAR